MKARIINTPVEVEVLPYFQEGMFAGFTDVSGMLRPGMVVYKPSDLEFIDRPAPLDPIVDWVLLPQGGGEGYTLRILFFSAN